MNHEKWSAEQTATTLTVDGHDLEVAYYEDGTENAGPPVVFLHGIPTWSFLWREVAPALAADRHVVVPDLLGYGNSAQHDGFDRSIRAQEMMLDALLDRLGADSTAIVAHDIGGGTALRLAAHQPDRVERLVLSNVACYDSWPVEFIHGLGLPGMADELADDETLEEKMAFVFDKGLHDDAAEHGEFCRGMRAPWQSEIGRTSLVRNAIATNTNHTSELDYGEVTAATLLLWGADDVLQSIDYAERLEDDIAGETELVPLDEAYHWVVEDRSDAYHEEVKRFLGKT
ncbi:alpha/beta fold hydrolase [Halalkalicoccus salilacus]|uniref:alpha/beta fold hydrolase n=1 Tax=Halalkalicoccus TaxID=332246 RepID=UPI002F9629FA